MEAGVRVLLRQRQDVPPDDRWLAPQEAAVLAGLRFSKRRADWRLGRWTAKQAVAAALGPSGRDGAVRIQAASDGAPEALVGDRPAPLTISLTHRDGRSACAVGPAGMALGCDLEKVESRTAGFVGDYFTPSERRLVKSGSPAERDLLVTVVWSAKESALKALRTGLRADTRSVEVTTAPGSEGRTSWQPVAVRDAEGGRTFPGWWTSVDGFVLTVVTDPPSAGPPSLIGLEKIDSGPPFWQDAPVATDQAVLTSVPVAPLHPERFQEVLPEPAYRSFMDAVARAGDVFAGRVVWNVNSTARGGGVAEMLRSLLAYSRGAGVDARWVVMSGDPSFFAVTKRLHNHLHGYPGDGGNLLEPEADVYRATALNNAGALAAIVRPGDVVILHDPQTAGMAGPMKEAGAIVLWRCHVGLDDPNDLARRAWDFLRPHVLPADAYVFSRDAYVWEGLDRGRAATIPPSIDAFSPKNQELSPEQVRSILVTAGVFAGEPDGDSSFVHLDGTVGIVRRTADLSVGASAPSFQTPVVVQVSRWDRLKDPLGVIKGFVEHIAPNVHAHLVLAGPSVEAVADDPEGAAVLSECAEAWSDLSDEVASRVHLVCLPMDDGDENAAIVNALQRRADVVVQKSLAEGFGLTVAEAMWKARPVVASRIGGIQDQVADGSTSILVEATDLEEYGSAVTRLLRDREEADAMGLEAQRRVRDMFLAPRHLMQYLELLGRLMV